MNHSCAGCGSREVTRRESRSYPFPESGLDHVRLHGGVWFTNCRRCGGEYVGVEKELQLLEFLALVLFAKPGPLRGEELCFLRCAADLYQADVADRLGVRRESVAEREAKDEPGLSRAAEWHFRAVLLKAYRENLQNEFCNHLRPSQLKALGEIERSILARVDTPFDGKRRRKLDVHYRSGTWESSALPTASAARRKRPTRLPAVSSRRKTPQSRKRMAP